MLKNLAKHVKLSSFSLFPFFFSVLPLPPPLSLPPSMSLSLPHTHPTDTQTHIHYPHHLLFVERKIKRDEITIFLNNKENKPLKTSNLPFSTFSFTSSSFTQSIIEHNFLNVIKN